MWQPSTDISTLSLRSDLLRNLREYFYTHSAIEVDVPVLGCSTVTDPFLESIQCVVDDSNSDKANHQNFHYLQTSPEYFMKRILAAYAQDIFYLGKAFRKDEEGRKHNPEFTLLEWYRIGFDDRALADEVINLVQSLKPDVNVVKVDYASIFEKYCGINPLLASSADLEKQAQQHSDIRWTETDKTVWLDYLFTHLVEPNLPLGLTVVFDYPSEQAALARLEKNSEGQEVARRFEVFYDGIELANGYWELIDAEEQCDRFENNVLQRQILDKDHILIDQKFMAAITSGLPNCAGVAMGVDRLLMCLLGKKSLKEVQSFAFSDL